jgi:hypothetical protein
MVAQPYTKEDLELKLLALEVTERRFELFCRGVFLVIAVASAVVTLMCVLRGYHWPTPSLTSGPGVASTVALAVESRRSRSRAPQER